MDDSCAVCADTLKWVAYGPCGHREVCSTCVIRLRFICDDRHCCLCKSELKTIFITKAMGDYTKVKNDFAAFAADPVEGQVGPYWYHEGTQAYFDDLDHYKMIKAMCRLSCIVCDKKYQEQNAGLKKIAEFKNMEQLKSHLFNRHRLLMCGLCLEGRKVFMCEQKLYTRVQLDQHIKTGDSEVDGSESERGGFMGHPMCEFCQNPFYGENELYLHMSTEHFTCHICQRWHPGQYEYHRNYDDMEIHFRQEHHLCENESCLAKKFIVFATESELKRHNVTEHGGCMSRSKRNAALQIPIRFHYRRSYEQDPWVRGHGFRTGSSDNQLSLVTQGSIATANSESFHYTSTRDQEMINNRETSEVASIVGAFQALATADFEHSSRHCEALGNSRNGPLDDSSFPPLVTASNGSQQKLRLGSKGSVRSSMAARLRHQNNGTLSVPNTAPAWSVARLQSNMSASGSQQSRPLTNFCHLSTNASDSSSSSKSKPARVKESFPSSLVNTAQGTFFGLTANFASSSRSRVGTSKVSYSASAPNLVDRGLSDNSLSNFPPVYSAQDHKKAPSSSHPSPEVEGVESANKALVEKIRASLEFDKDKYSTFKGITAEYRHGSINTQEYLAYVHQFGLSHLVLEIARLFPNVQKQSELMETYNFNMTSGCSHKNGLRNDAGQSKNNNRSKKGKEKCEEEGSGDLKHALADGIRTGVKALQPNQKTCVEEAEVLLKDGHHTAEGKSKVLTAEETNSHFPLLSQMESRTDNYSQPVGDGSKKDINLGGGNKPQKKMSKFLRNRLGDASAGLLVDIGNCDPGPDQIEGKVDEDKEAPEGLPSHGVWQNGGRQRLMAMTLRKPRK